MKIPYSYGKQVSENAVKPNKKDQSIYEKNVAKDIASYIVGEFGFEPTMQQVITRMLYNNLGLAKILPSRINVVVSILEKYGYSYKEALDIIESNHQILSKDSKDLMRSLAIAYQYGLDKDALLNHTIINIVNAEYLNSLIKELSSKGVEINEKNITSLRYDVNKSGSSKELMSKYPLTNKEVFTLSFMYDKYLRETEKSKSL